MEKSIKINDEFQLFIQHDPKFYNNVVMVELMKKDDNGDFSVLVENYGFDLSILDEEEENIDL